MNILRPLRTTCLTLTSLLLLTPVARAEVAATFVSGTGDDSNECTSRLRKLGPLAALGQRVQGRLA